MQTTNLIFESLFSVFLIQITFNFHFSSGDAARFLPMNFHAASFTVQHRILVFASVPVRNFRAV